MMLPQCLYSVRVKSRNALEPSRRGSPPRAATLALNSGLLATLSVAASRRWTTARGVPLGASTPFQVAVTKDGKPLSFMVGTWGSCGRRSAEVTASALSLPPWMKGSAGVMFSKMKSIWPPIRSVSAGALPL